jgi:hypothetical protein
VPFQTPYGHLKDDLPSSSDLGDLHVEFPEAILKLDLQLKQHVLKLDIMQ